MKSPWTRQADLARLSFGGLCAQLNLAQPSEGLHEISLSQTPLPGVKVLQVHTRSPQVPEEIADVYIRGQDLVVTYAETPQRPLRPQLYWRALEELRASEGFAALELIVSTQTQLLDSDPSLIVSCEFPAGEIQHLADAAGRFLSLGRLAQMIAGESGTGLLVFRPPAAPCSLVVCSFPADFEQAELALAAGGNCAIRYRLFSRPLEKGVILRGRLRAAFVPRARDEQAALACFQDFLKSPLPLTA